jgi:alpha-1,3-rhamnosyl/mannosyltransferase
LSVGTLEPRKNQARLIDAFSRLVQQERLPHHLAIVGAHGWKEGAIRSHARRSGVVDRIHFLGYVPAADLPGLYRAAAAFAFPSFYEGFGLPVLEALACGVPTLVSTDPALLEVAGAGTVVTADPHSTEDIAAGLWDLLTNEPLVAQLRKRGLIRAAEFSWDRSAAEACQIYRELLDEPPAATRMYATR